MTKGRIKTQNLVTLTLPTQQNLEKHLNTHMGHGEKSSQRESVITTKQHQKSTTLSKVRLRLWVSSWRISYVWVRNPCTTRLWRLTACASNGRIQYTWIFWALNTCVFGIGEGSYIFALKHFILLFLCHLGFCLCPSYLVSIIFFWGSLVVLYFYKKKSLNFSFKKIDGIY